MTAHHDKSLSGLTLRAKLVQSWNVGYDVIENDVIENDVIENDVIENDVIENDVIEIHSKNTCMTANLENISFFSIFLRQT